jgi:hypothetical protein
MTDALMNLTGLIEKAPDADILRQMISFAAERLMEMEVGTLTGAAYGEKSPERRAQQQHWMGEDSLRVVSDGCSFSSGHPRLAVRWSPNPPRRYSKELSDCYLGWHAPKTLNSSLNAA